MGLEGPSRDPCEPILPAYDRKGAKRQPCVNWTPHRRLTDLLLRVDGLRVMRFRSGLWPLVRHCREGEKGLTSRCSHVTGGRQPDLGVCALAIVGGLFPLARRPRWSSLDRCRPGPLMAVGNVRRQIRQCGPADLLPAELAGNTLTAGGCSRPQTGRTPHREFTYARRRWTLGLRGGPTPCSTSGEM